LALGSGTPFINTRTQCHSSFEHGTLADLNAEEDERLFFFDGRAAGAVLYLREHFFSLWAFDVFQ
jgi:hypothetical protein